MALIICPECGKQISDKAAACPNCGCPITNYPRDIKIRCLSTDRTVKYLIFCIDGFEVARGAVGTVVTIKIDKPTRITIRQKYAVLSSGDTGSFTAESGKCYEAKFCKPGIAVYKTIVSEVSFIS